MTTIAEQLEAAGFQKGIEKGVEKGIEKGELALLSKLLVKRFGPLPDPVNTRLESATIAELEAWADNIFEMKDLSEITDA